MRSATLSRLELRIMQTLWSNGPCSIRTLLEAFPRQDRLAYTTVQTVVNRLEAKGAIRRVDEISNAHVFEAAISQASAQHRMLDELVAWFGGKPLPDHDAPDRIGTAHGRGGSRSPQSALNG